MMERIVRYKNNTLYSVTHKRFVNLRHIREMHKKVRRGESSGFQVVQTKTNKDVTAEVIILAIIDLVRKKDLWKNVSIKIEKE